MNIKEESVCIRTTKKRAAISHEPNVPAAPYHCEVCNVVTCDSIKCGAYACEACKKFFLRNRNNENLRCLTGLNNCTFGDDNSRALVSASGKFWRMLCPKCRLARCKTVGMRMVHKNPAINEESAVKTRPFSVLPSHQQITPITDNPSTSQQECMISEDSLRAIVNGGRELMMSFESLPLRNNNDLENYNEIEAFQAGLRHFDCIVQVIKEFVARTPGYSALAVGDRCTLFAASTPTITLAATNKRAPTLCGLSPINGTHFIKLFSEFEYTTKESAHLWNAMANWNACPAEFSLLLSLLFYQGGLPCFEEISKSVRQLTCSLQAYLFQRFGGNQVYVESRLQQLSYLLGLIQEAGIRRNIAFAEVKQRNPHLFTLNRYLAEIHEKNKDSYSNRIKNITNHSTSLSNGIKCEASEASTSSSTCLGNRNNACH